MSLSNKPFKSISRDNLQSLIDNKVSESKTIEYKETLPGNSDDAKKEFLADVTSFANAAGGHLIFGIKEESGLPREICGLETDNPDSEILRLENIIRDCVDPRIPGINIQSVPLETSRVVIIVRMPRSWALPHMVRVKGFTKFYSRNSAGKYALDVSELRQLFAFSEITAERIKNFRTERLGKIVAGETPVPLEAGAKIALHIVPLTAFDPGKKYDVSSLSDNPIRAQPIYASGWDHRHNFDGFLTYAKYSREPAAHSYLQVFRTGEH